MKRNRVDDEEGGPIDEKRTRTVTLTDSEIRLIGALTRRRLLGTEDLEVLLRRRGGSASLAEALVDSGTVGDEELAAICLEEKITLTAGGPARPRRTHGSAPLPDCIGPYRILETIGQGGMGTVYKAHDPQLDRTVALKVIDARAGDMERFAREGRLVAALDHPYIVKVHGFSADDADAYMAMDHVDGTDLQALLDRGPLAPRQAATLLARVARGVDHAHEHGIIHRDLKPANILVDEKGDPRVVDFGLARSLDERTLTQTGLAMGTPHFMSPEQISGRELDRRSDVYSLGVILYLALSGELPSRARSLTTLALEIREVDPIPLARLDPSIPPDLEAVAFKALEKHTELRYATARGFAEDLERFLDGDSVSARRIGAARLVWRRLRKRWRVALPIGALAVALGALGAFHLSRRIDDARRIAQRNVALEEARRQLAGALEESRRERDGARSAEKVATAALSRFLAERDRARRTERIRRAWHLVGRAIELYRARAERSRIVELLDAAERAAPGYSRALRLKGRLALDDRKWTAARSLLERARAAEPDDYVTHLLLYRWYFEQGAGNTAAAQRHVVAAARYGTDTEIGWWGRGLRALERARRSRGKARAEALAEALAAARRALVRKPGFVWGLMLEGLALHHLGRFAEALAAHGRAIEVNGSAATYFNRANVYLDMGRHEAALADYDRALAASPGLAEAYNNRGTLHRRGGRSRQALEDYGRAIAARPRLVEAYVNRGGLLLQLGRVGEALVDLDAAVRLDPGHAGARYNRALVRERLAEPRRALADYTRAIECDPGHVDARINRAVLRQKLGERQAALADYDEAIRLVRRDARTHLNRAILLHEMGLTQRALADLDAAVRIDPGMARAHFVRGLVHLAGRRYREALAGFSAAIAADRKLTEAYHNRAFVLSRLGRHAEALADCHEAVRLAPQDPDAWYNRGNRLMKLGRHAEALADYDRAVALAPPPARLAAVHAHRGNALVALGRFAAALATYDRSIQLDGRSAAVYYNRGTVQGLLRNFAAALADHDRAIRLDPRHAAARHRRGYLHLVAGRPAAARADYDEAIRLDPRLAVAFNSRAVLGLKEGKLDQALADALAAVRLEPSNPDYWYNVACARARRGEAPEALDALEKAVSLGYRDVETLRADRDLDGIRGRARFAQIEGKLRVRRR